eukprot:EG_transcript_13408
MEARVPKICQLCQETILVGQLLLPLTDAEGVVHLTCGQERGLRPPSCRHWLRGRCLSGDSCFFSHPQEAHGVAAAPAQGRAGRTLAGPRPGGRRPRLEVNNKFRASVLRRFLLDTYGPARLAGGSGVADVAGGKGVLAFELLNLHNILAFTVDPRPQDLAKPSRWLCDGFYHKSNPLFRRFVTRSLQQCQSSGPLRPPHVRLCVSPDVVHCVACPGTDGGPPDLLPLTRGLEAALHASPAALSHADEDAAEMPHSVDSDSDGERIEFEQMGDGTNSCDVYHLLSNASIFVGLHPDHATEAIVDLAIGLGRPFAVVPCCVCARSFPDRRLPDGGEVLRYDDFIKYLLAKDPGRVRTAQLDFEGRNTVVYRL